MTHHIFVDGQEGTTGLRIHEVLGQRDDIELLSIASERRKDAAERTRLLNAADVELAAFNGAVTDWERVRGFERL